MINTIRLALVLAMVGLLSGCKTFTSSHIDRLRARQAVARANPKSSPEIMGFSAKENTMYAGVDLLGVKEALAVDPSGTSIALTKDGLVAAVVGLITSYVNSKMNEGDSGDKKKDTTEKTKPGIVMNGAENTLSAPSTSVSGTIIMGGHGNSLNLYEPQPEASTP